MFHPSHSGLRAQFKAEASFFKLLSLAKSDIFQKKKKNCTWNLQICTKIGFEKKFFSLHLTGWKYQNVILNRTLY